MLVLAVAVVAVVALGAAVLYSRRHPSGVPSASNSTTMTVAAAGSGGAAPDAATLDQARRIIETRAKAAGFSDVHVTVNGQRTIVVSVAGTHAEDLPLLVAPARLRFRLVLDATPATASEPEPANPSAAPEPTPSPGATPGAGGATLAAVVAKLGPAYQVAEQIQDPGQVDDETVAQLAPFGLLSPDEVAVLPPAVQFKVPTVSCAQLDGRPFGAIEAVDQQVVACELSDTASTKYLLDRATVVGDDVAKAEAISRSRGWVVDVQFKSGGQQRWTQLTEEASRDGAQRQVAIVLDNSVVAAPAVQSTAPGDAEIAADFTKERAQTLASLLQSGVLPLTCSIVSIEQHK